MIKYKKLIALELEKYPAKCNDCPMFYTTRYQCHNECGIEGHCELGYMDGYDMRDFMVMDCLNYAILKTIQEFELWRIWNEYFYYLQYSRRS